MQDGRAVVRRVVASRTDIHEYVLIYLHCGTHRSSGGSTANMKLPQHLIAGAQEFLIRGYKSCSGHVASYFELRHALG